MDKDYRSEILAWVAIFLVATFFFATLVGIMVYPQIQGCMGAGPTLEEVLEP